MQVKSRVRIIILSLFLGLFPVASGAESAVKIGEALLILSSASLQTQGMAMVLGNSMQGSGVDVHILLCDKAGDLALANHQSARLKPKDVSPKMLLSKLQKGGAKISVCALYLPNSQYVMADLMDGVGAAKPPEITALMLNKAIRVFTF